jgi:hypothetical protein
VTEFDAAGSAAKIVKRKPGEPRPLASPPPTPLPLPPGPPQVAAGIGVAPQIPARAGYADAYRTPDTPPRRQPPLAVDAFDPIGLRISTFIVKPSIEVTRGFESNVKRIPGSPGSAFTVVEPALQVRSDWSRGSYGFNLRGSYTWYDTVSSSNRPLIDFKSFTRYDVTRDTTINMESRYFLSTDYPGSPNIPADIAKLPIFASYGYTAGLAQRFNRLELSVKGSFDRTTYEESELTNGSTFSNHDRDFNQFGVQARATYELTPGLKPFVEMAADTRQHDLEIDRNGFHRDSQALTPRVGTTFEFSRILTGEVSVAYLSRQYDDPALSELKGVLVDGSLIWSVTGLTTATLNATSRGEEVVVAGVSGALRRDVGLQIDHAFRRWLIGTLRAGVGYDEYIGNGRNDTRTSLGAAISYKLNREFWLKGEYRHDQLRSNVAGVDYDADVFMIGLKLQR